MLALFSLSSQPVTSCLLASRKCCVDRLRPPDFAAPTQSGGSGSAEKACFRGHFLHAGLIGSNSGPASRRPPLGDIDDHPPDPSGIGLAFEGGTQVDDLVTRVDRYLKTATQPAADQLKIPRLEVTWTKRQRLDVNSARAMPVTRAVSGSVVT